MKKYYKVTGSKKQGFKLNIPMEAYLESMQPKEYTCAAMQDGTLVYQPVKQP